MLHIPTQQGADNGDYNQFYYNGASKANPVALIGDIIQDVAQYAF